MIELAEWLDRVEVILVPIMFVTILLYAIKIPGDQKDDENK